MTTPKLYAPGDPLSQPLSPFAIIGILFIAAVAIFAYVVSQSNGSTSSILDPSEATYKVQMPNGDIKTMSESQLVETNKRAIKERDEQVKKFQSELNKSGQEMQRELDKLKDSSRSR